VATRFYERLAQTRLKPRTTPAPDWRAALGHAAFRRRVGAVVLMLVSVTGVSIGSLAGDLGYAPLVAGGIGVYGLHLWRP